MTGLVLKLGPRERVLINGAIIENGDRRARFSIVTPQTHVLRLRDAFRPEEANTPVRRLCYSVQLVLSGDASPADSRLKLLRGLEGLGALFPDPESRALLATATEAVENDQYYPCLKALRALLRTEDEVIAAALP